MSSDYYDVALLKPPVWTWEVPVYFFVGGAAGGAAVIGNVAAWSGLDGRLVRDARWIAAVGGPISAALLTADLGRPERFLNMLRVFKPQSAMSVGSWTLTAFCGSSAGALLPVRAIAVPSGAASALLGCGMLTYTGVLIGATAIPTWHAHVRTLPIHFAASGLGSAAAVLTLLGHDDKALNRIAIGAAAAETLAGAAIERERTDATRPLRSGTSGVMVRAGGVLSGPVPLILRAVGRSPRWRKAASASALAGSLLTRMGWLLAGRASANQKPAPRGPGATPAGAPPPSQDVGETA
ncbi:MAG TPA: NrfD/PsrC family molybdoenzyme membrane anchor subunit [Vicinamibacterales bacterium]|jgi:hypothetical protein